jgi:alkylation response protein AidB-like acyl-CoA dehydrogenase
VEEEARFLVPREHETFNVTVNLVGPTIAVYGTEEQKDRFIPPFIRTDMLCCQLFSEPNAGSDLASLSCSAKQVGDSWIIDGQKVWTSGARLSEYGLLIARSDTTGAKHAGMTAFLLPLNLPGVEIRPIRQMTGGASFNEVFMTNVELSDDYRLGAVGEGWKVALTTLGFERNSSADGAGGAGGTPQQLIALAQHLGKNTDPVARQMLAEVYSMGRIAELSGLRMRGTLSAGQDPGPLGSLGKLFWTQRLNRTSDVATYLLGADLMADSGEWGKYAWAEHVLGAPGYRIAGGSDEIQRNIIGERALGLPREPR